MATQNFDFVIIGSGAVGLFLAYQLRARYEDSSILIIEKESKAGLHTSGRNSGVLHAGIYYKPKSLKAQVCQSGAKRLKHWIEEYSLPLNKCGKLIVPHEKHLDCQIDMLAERSKINKVNVEIWNEKQLRKFFPAARSSTGRALWSPDTCVTNPQVIIEELVNQLKDKNVRFKYGFEVKKQNIRSQSIQLNDDTKICFGYLFNCAGLYAIDIAKSFGIGHEFKIIPFKGTYWKLRKNCPISIPCNLYPVPDLNLPFLGIHFTPSAGTVPTISIGPTATLALGRENYTLNRGIEALELMRNLIIIGSQYMANKGSFRKYVQEQSPQVLKHFMLKQAKKLIPDLEDNYVEKSSKVGIRPQLYSTSTKELIDDFMCINAQNSTHVLNGISPAFTASFELADLIITQSNLSSS